MPARKKKSVPQRWLRTPAPRTPMQLPLTPDEVLRLQRHMHRHGPRSLSLRQHNALWDFLFDQPESQHWLPRMAEQIAAGQQARRA